MAKLEQIFIGFALVGLFIFAMISFGVQLQQDNNVTEGIIENDVINKTYSDLSSELGSSKGSMSEGMGKFENETASTGTISLIFHTIPTIGKTIRGIVTGVFGILVRLPARVLGINEIVIGVLEAILLVLLIVGLWRLYKVGG
jgi:hypothetical protein